ncbi:ABC transporter permease [Leucobacter allii]|uniref:ABC transporter permease n=1 Tax=Leucobacter allii TaxID=2932247 RepID=A0ABY4FM83_9MICO|nr:ABC transporter permease [Leucobacter allii]UOQ57392.1 ABC transporter permease [Leucobacter allii]UOR01840.1 ABC transporter permease [Leucobacter allii]
MAQTDTLTIPAAAQERPRLTQLVWQGSTVLALIALIIVFTIAGGGVFLTPGNLTNILNQVAILTIIAAAQTVVMVVGDFDLSVGTNATLSGATAAALMINGVSIPVAILLALGAGTLIGMVNGVLVAYLNLSAFVATLAMMTTVGGLALIVTGGTTLYGMPEAFGYIGQMRINGIPSPVIYAVVLALIMWAVLRFTTIGRRWYAIGGNAEVARLSGVSVRSTRFLAFTVAGFLSALGGVVLVSRLASAGSASANDLMMFAVAAVFLGMTLLKSGQANIGGTLVGVAIIGVVNNGLNIIGVNTYIQQVLIGAIIVGAVLLSGVKTQR